MTAGGRGHRFAGRLPDSVGISWRFVSRRDGMHSQAALLPQARRILTRAGLPRVRARYGGPQESERGS